MSAGFVETCHRIWPSIGKFGREQVEEAYQEGRRMI
jgi:hypothetical protein